MRLGGDADYLTRITSEDDLLQAIEWVAEKNIPMRMIGGGSNIIWSGDGFRGLVMINDIRGIHAEDHTFTAGAGEVWNTFVGKTVEQGFGTLAPLSLIPGTVGACPIQNIGAYGAEVKESIVSVRAYDVQTRAFVDMSNEDCAFGYRRSRFNTSDKGRFLITSVTFELSKDVPGPPFYKSLQEYLDEKAVTDYTPQIVRDAVIAIRQSKLPDPSVTPNCGSFFKNPVVSIELWNDIVARHPHAPHWEVPDGIKLSAGWLIDQAGFAHARDEGTGMGTYEKHPLVLVNHSASTADDMLSFAQKITDAVFEMFGIALEREPELIS